MSRIISFSELTSPPTEAATLATLISGLQFYGYPVTSWQSGSVGRTLVQVDAKAIADLRAQVAYIAQSSLLQTAADDWLDQLATQFFQEDRYLGASTEGYVVVTDAASTGPHTVALSSLWVSVGASGLRYNNTATITVPLGGSAAIPVRAEAIGAAYNVANTTINVVGSAGYPGITVSNPAVAAPGALATTGIATGNASVYLEVVAGAAVSSGSATYQLSVNGGGTFGPTTALPATGLIVINGVTFAFSGTLSSGDVVIATLISAGPASGVSYLSALTTSNTWITRAGRDVESDDSLRTRCVSKWGVQSSGATRDAYIYWAKKASEQVTKVTVKESTPATGIVQIVLAGASGGVSAATIADVRAYIDTRRPLTAAVVLLSASLVTVSVAGTVFVQSAFLANAQSEAAANFAKLTDELDMGAIVYRAEIIQRVMDALGVINFTMSSPVVDVALTPAQVVNFDLSGLTWVAA